MEAGGDSLKCSTENTLNIDTVVLVVTLILDSDKSVAYILGKIVNTYPHTICVGCHEALQLFAVLIHHEGSVSLGFNIRSGDGRSIRDHVVYYIVSNIADCRHSGDTGEQKQAKKNDLSFAEPLAFV